LVVYIIYINDARSSKYQMHYFFFRKPVTDLSYSTQVLNNFENS